MSVDGNIVVEKTYSDYCKWVIDDFCGNSERSYSYKSRRFKTGTNNENEWYLTILANNLCKCMYLHLVDCCGEEIRISLRVFIESDDNNKSEYLEDTFTLKKGNKQGILLYSVKKRRKKSFSFTPGEKLTIVCQINDISISRDAIKKTKYFLLNDLDLFGQDQKFRDVVLSVEGKNFLVHKFFLIARSPVFRAMFENKMIENKIEITDVSYDVMQEVLRFIYTDDVENIERLASSILAAADKYQLEHLKIICLEFLCNHLEEDSALDTLILADVYKADFLKNKTFDYIISHLENIDISALSLHPHLYKEMLVHCKGKVN